MDLKLTPLFQEHKDLAAQMAPFGGWLMPIQYSGILNEHIWTRKRVSVFDICHMGEFLLKADPVKSGLDRILTNNLKDMPCGKCRYTSMLNEKGGIIDDLIIYRIKPDEWMLVVNAATTNGDEANLRKYLSNEARLENVSSKVGKLDLQGPLSRETLGDIIGSGINRLKYYTFDYFDILGEKNIVSRTGYTGELGYEIYLSNPKIKELWALLLKDGSVKPAGLGARDTLRLEMGYSLYGQDIDLNITPLEAGMERYLDFNKDFIGKDALLKQKKSGLVRNLISFVTVSRRSARHNYKIWSRDQEIGFVTSGSFAPSLGVSIGMGYVKNGVKIRDKIILKDNNVEIEATIADKPFYKNSSLKS
ncbi:MAG: glycine cleavage system aminomethyltransferase GcvT [Candidatus Omnitrophota bacterium]|nr:glycine cleavage system aminomethyltransferase GcvT [Candidatus Omnitrophota bacterium]MBU2034404.1 glycine cleavage system aminomethyltransferase GcvT [Candidatus Omnitrophota bacterium]